jgi:hypothetical protein
MSPSINAALEKRQASLELSIPGIGIRELAQSEPSEFNRHRHQRRSTIERDVNADPGFRFISRERDNRTTQTTLDPRPAMRAVQRVQP